MGGEVRASDAAFAAFLSTVKPGRPLEKERNAPLSAVEQGWLTFHEAEAERNRQAAEREREEQEIRSLAVASMTVEMERVGAGILDALERG